MDSLIKLKMNSDEKLAAKFMCSFEGCTLVFNQLRPFKRHKRSHIQSAQKAVKLERKCGVCGAVFNGSFKLECHLRSHTGERPFLCGIEGCSKSYTSSSHLRRHKNVSHDKDPTKRSEFMCGGPHCGKVFETKYGLKRHILRNHSAESNPFVCEQCHQRFKKRSKLQAHMGIHGENQMEEYKCEQCTLSFPTQIILTKHIRNHRTYTCNCSKTFVRWSEICRHRRESCTEKQEHKCVICGKVLSTKTNLTVHALTHVEESKLEVFRCPYPKCFRSYKYKKNLTYHIGFFHEKIRKTIVKEEKDETNTDFKCKEEPDIDIICKEEPGIHFLCKEEDCDVSFDSKKKLNKHRRLVHLHLPEKKRFRKDRGKKKKPTLDWVSELSVNQIKSRKTLETNVVIEDHLEKDRAESSIASTVKIDTDNKVHKQNSLFKDVSSSYKSYKFNIKKQVERSKSERTLAPIGSGVISRKRKIKRDHGEVNESTENCKKIVYECGVHANTPSEILLSETEKQNVPCEIKSAKQFVDPETIFFENKEITAKLAEENNKVEIRLKPLKIVVEKLNLIQIKEQIKANNMNRRQLKIILKKLNLKIRNQEIVSSSNINYDPQATLDVREIYTNTDNEIATPNNVSESAGAKDIVEKQFAKNMSIFKSHENSDRQIKIISDIIINSPLSRTISEKSSYSKEIVTQNNPGVVHDTQFSRAKDSDENQIVKNTSEPQQNSINEENISGNKSTSSSSEIVMETDADTHQQLFKTSTAPSSIEEENISTQNDLKIINVSECAVAKDIIEKQFVTDISSFLSQETNNHQLKIINNESSSSAFQTILKKDVDVHQKHFIATSTIASDIKEGEPDSLNSKSTSESGHTLDQIKDILKNLSPDQTVVESALEKIKNILENNKSTESQKNDEHYKVLLNADGFVSQFSSSVNSVQLVEVSNTVSIQNFVDYENIEILSCPSIGENVIILPFEADC